MTSDLARQIAEMGQFVQGMSAVERSGGFVDVRGLFKLHATLENLTPLELEYELKLCIPPTFPNALPRAWETSGQIAVGYRHLYKDGSLCLGVGFEQYHRFRANPTLAEYVTTLLVPHLYGHRHKMLYGKYPFPEELDHSEGATVNGYMRSLELANALYVPVVIRLMLECQRKSANLGQLPGAQILSEEQKQRIAELVTIYPEVNLVRDLQDAHTALWKWPEELMKPFRRIISRRPMRGPRYQCPRLLRR